MSDVQDDQDLNPNHWRHVQGRPATHHRWACGHVLPYPDPPDASAIPVAPIEGVNLEKGGVGSTTFRGMPQHAQLAIEREERCPVCGWAPPGIPVERVDQSHADVGDELFVGAEWRPIIDVWNRPDVVVVVDDVPTVVSVVQFPFRRQ